MTFGEKLKKARMEAGYTQNELANKLSVSRAAIAKWESDRGMSPVFLCGRGY
jgi:transcriptional regulator with XRE-family HTH domain